MPHTYRCLGLTPGWLMWVITPSGFGGFFEEIGAVVAVGKDPQPPPDIPRVMEMAKKFGLEFPPPPDA